MWMGSMDEKSSTDFFNSAHCLELCCSRRDAIRG